MKVSKRCALFIIFALFSVIAAAGGPAVQIDVRRRVETPAGSDRYKAVIEKVNLDPKETAVVICDMWDRHWCPSATDRVAELAPAIDRFVRLAREKGMTIVHAPSDTMSFYRGHPARKNALEAPLAKNLPLGMVFGRSRIGYREMSAQFPIDDSDGGCDAPVDKDEVGKSVWTRQTAAIEIKPQDYILDSGATLWNVMEERAIKNVLMVGVHTNMCVVGRSFGLRNLVLNGKNAYLVRDLTDSMYNPAMPPGVDHFTGTGLVIEHIEKYICPTVTSAFLTGEPRFTFRADTRPRE